MATVRSAAGAPTPRQEDLGAAGATIPDLLAPHLRVLFCGINPGLRSASTGLHFARPGNRFWRVLHSAGFTDRLLTPDAQEELLGAGVGITNLVARSSAGAADVTLSELRAGALALVDTAGSWQPAAVAILGLDAYRTAFRRPLAVVGRQPETLADSLLWLLPNPSGLQARYQLPEMVEQYRALRRAVT